MKFLNLTFVLSLWATFLFAQSNVVWEALPEQRGIKAKLVYQASHGNLFAKIDVFEQYTFSSDDGETWHNVTIPNTLPIYYFYFTSDEIGNLFCFAKNKVYKLDTSDYEFKIILTFETNAWVSDIQWKNGKIYVMTDNGLKIYDAKNLTLLSNNINMQKCSKLLLGKNQNYALKYLSAAFEYEVYTFNETDFKTTPQGKIPLGAAAILNSDKLVYTKNDTIITSSDFGKSWQPLLPYRNASYFYINRQKEMIINNKGIFQMSADDGQTWEDLPSPKDKILDNYWLENPRKQLIFEHTDCLNTELYLSKDRGKTWNDLSLRIGKPSSEALLITPNDEILTQNCYTFEQIKGKDNWESINQSDSVYLQSNYQFTIFPSGKWFAQRVFGLYYTSINNGKAWKRFIFPKINTKSWSKFNFVINQNKELLYFNNDTTYLSKDEGLTWAKLTYNYKDLDLENPQALSLKDYQYLIIKDNSILNRFIFIYNSDSQTPKYLDKINGRYINNTSKLLDLGNEKFGFIDYLNRGEPIYLHISSDYGETFKTKKIVIGKDAAFSNIINGIDNSIILITTKDVLVSYDEGDTWISIKGNLPIDVPYSDAILDTKQYLYLGTRGAAIFKTKMPLSKIIATVEKDKSEFDIQISPNPVTDILNIQIFNNEFVNSSVEIFNLEGKIVKALTVNDKNVSLDISVLPMGMYVLQVKNERKNQIKKFIKQ
jgi:photosystem II stability/assembly factor-like uncharacterized protein